MKTFKEFTRSVSIGQTVCQESSIASVPIEITRVANGIFSVTRDGKNTGYEIVNAYAGMSGMGSNKYAIRTPDGKIKLIGSLQLAKKTVSKWISDKDRLSNS